MMERRIKKLEAAHNRGVDRADLEALAASVDVDPDVLLAEAEAIIADIDRNLPGPHTLERMVQHLSRKRQLSRQDRDEMLADILDLKRQFEQRRR